jgi:thiopeptide-type bacteriocin biosynthesis protein
MIEAFQKFVYRIPQYPIGMITHSQSIDDFNSYFTFFFRRPEFKEALFTASPEFYNEVELYLAGKISPGKRLTKFYNTAMKYIARMGTRSTPFGLFSACGIGSFGNISSIVPDNTNGFIGKVRLDMELLTSYSEYIHADKKLRNTIKFYPNNTIYEFAGKYRYVEFSIVAAEKLYKLSSFEKTDFIDMILEEVRQGLMFDNLVSLLINKDISKQEAEEYVEELIKENVLISELEPYMTGIEYHDQIFNFIDYQNKLYHSDIYISTFYEKSLRIFKTINYLINDINTNDYSVIKNIYQQILDQAKLLDIKYEVKNHIQVDSYCANNEGGAYLSKDVLNQIIEGVTLITRFTSNGSNASYLEFKKKFKEKYNNQFVSLSVVLDPETGLGYGNINNEMLDIAPFIDDMPIGNREINTRKMIAWDVGRHSLILKKIIEAEKKGLYSIQFTRDEIELLKPNTSRLPPTFNAFVSVSYDKDSKPWIYFNQVGTASATSLIGRFGFGNSEIHQLINEICDFESLYFSGKIVAEINHLSESRAGNIMLRPKFRNYEICYLTKSNLNETGKIEIGDLFISLNNERFILYSKKLNKEIIPRLSNAHNFYKDTLPVYKFLCDLQEDEFDGYIGLFTDIGSIPELVDFIPRLTYKNFIIFPAQWFIETEKIKRFSELPDVEFHKNIVTFLKEKNIPDWFFLTNRESDYFVDINNVISLRSFIEEIKHTVRFSIKECLNLPDSEYLVRNSLGNYFHEIIVPLRKTASTNNQLNLLDFNRENSFFIDKSMGIKRKYFPGEEWVFFKIYLGVKIGENLVTHNLPEFIEYLKKNDIISIWFFIRYTDPAFHIRLRVKLKDINNYGFVINYFQSYFKDKLDSGQIKNLMLDTYDRELERYGYASISNAESIFNLDSELCIQLLTSIDYYQLAEFKWLIALGVIDCYLTAFEFSDTEKHLFAKKIRDAFAVEFNANKMQRRYFITKFRNYKLYIDNFLDRNKIDLYDLSWYEKIISIFGKNIHSLFRTHYIQMDEHELQNFLSSFIHMFLDRFFSSKNRHYEYALYSLIEQFYRYKIGKFHNINNDI